MSKTPEPEWMGELTEGLICISKEKGVRLAALIQKMGMDESSRQEWVSLIKERVTDTYEELTEEALTIQNKLLDNIEELLQKASVLCKLLQIKLPQYGSENLSFFEEREMLKIKVEELEAVVNSRKQELEDLKKRQDAACLCLGREPKTILESPLPSAQKIDEFTSHIKALELEVLQREDHFFKLKSKIIEIAAELGIKPMLDIEQIVLSPDDSSFKVTDSNMKWVEEYYASLKKQREHIKLEIQNLRECVGSLWEMLSEDIKTCNEFMQTHVGTSVTTLDAWKTEMRRCEELKKANIEKFVKRLRNEIFELWEKCHMSTSERDKFEYYHCTLFTEDLLTFHDIEIANLQKYYEDNKEMLTLLEKWRHSWNKMIDLEERASAPNRFKNRGGTLLKEEKERNMLLKRLPEYEKRLEELADNFLCRTGKPFLSWGETIADTINQAHGLYKQKKETQLIVRKQQKALTPGKTTAMSGSKLTLNSPYPSRHLSAQKTPQRTLLFSNGKNNKETPHLTSAQKRSPLTPLFSNRKKTKVGTPVHIPKIKINNETLKRRSITSIERKKELMKMRRIKKNANSKKNPEASETIDYDIFKKELSSKEFCRSTLFGGPSDLVAPLPQTSTNVEK